MGLYRSAVDGFMISPVIPAPSPALKIVPKFPGSWMASKIIRWAFPGLPKISSKVVCFCLTKANMPWGVWVSAITFITGSDTVSQRYRLSMALWASSSRKRSVT